MKNLILSIFFCLMTLSCATNKKTSETEKKQQTELYSTSNVNNESKKKSENESKESKESENSSSEVNILYKPQIDLKTGQFKPFKYEAKKDGKTNTSIEISGNGEVMIRNLNNQIKEQSESTQKQFEQLNAKMTSEINYLKNELTNEKTITKEQKQSVFKLWIVIIVLSILLLVSLYFHATRFKIPFLTK